MPLLPFVLPAKSRALQNWPQHDWLPSAALPPRAKGQTHASFHNSAEFVHNSAASVKPAESLAADARQQSEPTELATSSILRLPVTTEHSATEEEWHGVGQLLTGLRMQTLKASPASAEQYAKQTTDTDIWAWKQTGNWGNRRVIRGYLQREKKIYASGTIERLGSRKPRTDSQRPKSAPRRQKRNVMPARPHTASRLRRAPVKFDRGTAVATVRDSSTHDEGIKSSSAHRIDDVNRSSDGDETAHLPDAIQSTGAEWVYSLAMGGGGRRGDGSHSLLRGRRRRLEQLPTRGTPSARPRYRISRRRRKSFAAVTVRDKLILERVARKMQAKRHVENQAAARFRLEHQAGQPTT